MRIFRATSPLVLQTHRHGHESPGVAHCSGSELHRQFHRLTALLPPCESSRPPLPFVSPPWQPREPNRATPAAQSRMSRRIHLSLTIPRTHGTRMAAVRRPLQSSADIPTKKCKGESPMLTTHMRQVLALSATLMITAAPALSQSSTPKAERG